MSQPDLGVGLEGVLAQSDGTRGCSGSAHGRTFAPDEVDAGARLRWRPWRWVGVGAWPAWRAATRSSSRTWPRSRPGLHPARVRARWTPPDGALTTSTRVVPVTGQDRARARPHAQATRTPRFLRHAAELLAEAGVAESLT